jgi:hypothetical protein
LVLSNSAPHSASTADDMTLRMIVDLFKIGPFPHSGLLDSLSPI